MSDLENMNVGENIIKKLNFFKNLSMFDENIKRGKREAL